LKNSQALLEQGNAAAAQGRWDAAERGYAACCKLQPGNAVAQHNWGVALLELGRAHDAIAAYERALAANPRYAQAYCSLGIAYQAIGVPDAALVALDCACQLDGQNPRLAIERARVLVNLGRPAQALGTLEGLAASQPRNAVVFNLLGIALKQLRRPDEAATAFGTAIALQPAQAEALNNRGNLQLQARRFKEALQDFDAALALQPDMPWLRGTRLYTAAHLFAWNGFDAERAAIIEGIGRGARIIQPLALQTLVDDPALQQQAARLWTHAACPRLQGATTTARVRASRKIRIAYVSKDFRSHPVSFLMAEVIELHDREHFEVIAVNYGPASEDPMQQRLRAAFDGFLDVEALTDADIAQACRSLNVDIVVDLTGFTDGARSAIFALRAAPVQVSYLGYLGGSGTALYDYLIADKEIVPAEFRACYDERIAYLPSYQANDRQRPCPDRVPGRASLGLPESGFVFCCFNNPCKISPELFARWARILAEVPDSVLWLLGEDGHAPAELRRHGQALGLDPARLVFASRADRSTYLARLAAADLFLDTLPYNAGTTASDALWIGLPVLTQRGRSFAGRVATSLLMAVGLPELIASDADEYVARAIELARQPARLSKLRQQLVSARAECRLFDAPRFTRSLEAAYAHMHQRAAAGEPPCDLELAEPT